MFYFILESKLIIHINGKEVTWSEIGLNVDEIKTIDEFECLLNSLDNIKCCSGLEFPTHLNNTSSLLGQNVIASNGNIKHKNCQIILKDYDG